MADPLSAGREGPAGLHDLRAGDGQVRVLYAAKRCFVAAARQTREAEAEWLELNTWVNWLRRTYGLPASVIPPFWHHHPELVWELSALHLHWPAAYDIEQNASAPLGWHRDFADARQRLRDWVAACGTRLDRDRPTQQTAWPGEDPAEPVEDRTIAHRDEDVVQFVLNDVATRRQAEQEFYASLGHVAQDVDD